MIMLNIITIILNTEIPIIKHDYSLTWKHMSLFNQ